MHSFSNFPEHIAVNFNLRNFKNDDKNWNFLFVKYILITNFILDKGVCLPTLSLWLLFVYIEASVRLKDLKNLPFHMDLCRPFAAHW